jgi:hypothetical protein
MRCPACGGIVKERPKSYQCACGLIVWKEVAGKKITPEIVKELLVNGRTGILEGFKSRSGKSFSARLILDGKKVSLQFPEKRGGSTEPAEAGKSTGKDVVYIRVESGHSGTARINIEGVVSRTAEVNYGLVSSRMAECLGTLTAVKLVEHCVKDPRRLWLDIRLNNLNFSRYLLRERVPRDKEIRSALKILWEWLENFAGWRARYQPVRRPRLQGSPRAMEFPRGMYPWLYADVTDAGSEIIVKLPDTPDVLAQFKASIRKAEYRGNGTFVVPGTVQKVVMAWISTVRG